MGEIMCPFTLPPGFSVVGYRSIVDAGSFQKGEVYVLGERSKPVPCYSAQVVDGWQGKETKVVVEGILPIRTFIVRKHKSHRRYR